MIKETPKTPLEESLNKVVIRLIAAAEAKKAERLEWERRRAEEEAERRSQEEIQQRKREERERYEHLLKQVNAWTRSNQIKAFVEATKVSAVKERGLIEPGSDLDQWSEWASQQADRIDPLRSLLHEYLINPFMVAHPR